MRGKRNPRQKRGRADLVKRVKAEGRPCWVCGMRIDLAREPGDPLAFELDEIVPVSKGGSPTDYDNAAASHRCCNQWRGNRSAAWAAEMRAAVRQRYGGWRSPLEFVELAKSIKGVKGSPIRHPKRSSGII